ncbi:MAG TPA: ABC transporter permease [Jatrophihabitans sp.]|jgi:osmoprotectant transport system permease protein|uniref:ABC transporter permease n=1 Tax=Jatrophihabitans sp. TaxID=1932789 RepID=UPI002E00804A|nr:ABC transporter permease [Jatrophihabitans sp.]
MSGVITWLNDPAHWRDRPADSFVGIPSQIVNHLEYSLIALGIALVIALPTGLAIGHSGRATWVVAAANALRSIPGVGLLVLLAVIIAPHFYGRTDLGYLIPTEIVLVLIAIPSILANTYAGVDNVDPAVRDAARGMGMSGGEVLRQVEFPNSLPLIFSGFRSATLQVIATATIASYFPLGGLGRFIYDGYHQQDYDQMVSGGILVALLAVLVDLVLSLVQRLCVSRGVSGRFSKTPTQDPATAALRTKEEVATG